MMLALARRSAVFARWHKTAARVCLGATSLWHQDSGGTHLSETFRYMYSRVKGAMEDTDVETRSCAFEKLGTLLEMSEDLPKVIAGERYGAGSYRAIGGRCLEVTVRLMVVRGAAARVDFADYLLLFPG